MSELDRITKERQEARLFNQDAANKNSDRGNLVPTQPFTYVVDDLPTLLTLDEDIDPTGKSSFKGRVPKDGDLAKTTGESINLDNEHRYFIRIDGEWVNILGLCNDEEANVQPVHGVRSHPGISKCLAAADHRHGIPDSINYMKISYNADGTKNEDLVEYDNATLRYDPDKKRGYMKCNERWICITHVE